MSITSLIKMFRRASKKSSQINTQSHLLNDQTRLSKHLAPNIDWLTNSLGNAPDMITREVVIGTQVVEVVFLEELVAKDIINDLLYGLMVDTNTLYAKKANLFDFVKEKTLNFGQIKERSTLGECLEAL